MPAANHKKQSQQYRSTNAKKRSAVRKKPTIRSRVVVRVKAFLSRRPHRSFRRTRRRDYARSLKIPGYWAFTVEVVKVIRANWKSLAILTGIYALLSVVLLGIGSQEAFTQLRETLNQTGAELFQGNWGEVGKAGLLAVTVVSGRIAPQLTEVQQVYTIILGLLAWLSVVWLIRQRLAGNKVKVRDALYNSGSPIIPTACIALVIVLQLLPVAVAVIGYSAASATGLLSNGIEAMLFWAAAAGLVTMSLYWLTSSMIALAIITLPGVYPLRALAIAGDMVVGRRLRILLRLAWVVVANVCIWAIILTGAVLIDAGVKHLLPVIEWLPIVPVTMLLLTVISLVVTATYIYLLYRRIVDDDAKPA